MFCAPYSATPLTTRRRRGLVLTELACAVGLAALLAGMAVPRFEGMEQASLAQDVELLANRIQAISELSHGLWLSQGRPTSVTCAGGVVPLQDGFPTCATLEALTQSGNLFIIDGRWHHRAARDPIVCAVYCESSLMPAAGPHIRVLTHGC